MNNECELCRNRIRWWQSYMVLGPIRVHLECYKKYNNELKAEKIRKFIKGEKTE